MQAFVDEQNKRLIAYAKDKIRILGDAIQLYPSARRMDRTGNLLNSLCWGVSYDGKLVQGGFYRDAVHHSNGIAGDSTSYIHEWFSGDEKYLESVDGRKLAEEYLEKYGNNGSKGWRVFFAILAPYWGYWEKGFTMKSGGGNSGIPSSSRFMQFAVMTQWHDKVGNELKPMRVRFRSSVRHYEHVDLQKKWAKKAGF